MLAEVASNIENGPSVLFTTEGEHRWHEALSAPYRGMEVWPLIGLSGRSLTSSSYRPASSYDPLLLFTLTRVARLAGIGHLAALMRHLLQPALHEARRPDRVDRGRERRGQSTGRRVRDDNVLEA